MAVSERPSPYRLDELGWLQFQHLCERVGEQMGIPASAWGGSAAILRFAAWDGGLRLPDGRRLDGPVCPMIAWARDGRLGARSVELIRSMCRRGDVRVLFTNHGADRLRSEIPDGDDLIVIGPEMLGRVIDEQPDLRLVQPSLLGVRELEPLLDPQVTAGSAFDLEAASELAGVFVPTEAHSASLAALARHGFVVLTGPPEMGKTAIARMIGLAQLTRGWEVHECIRPEQVLAAFRADRPQVFVADDAFGSTEYRPDAAERWALELDRILRAMDAGHWLIWTSRPAPLRAGLRRVHREHGVERFPQPAEVMVDAAALSVEEKALILYRHARRARLPDSVVAIVRRHGWEIVSNPHFTPERIRRFVGSVPGEPGETVLRLIEAQLREPTSAMAASLDALSQEQRALLVGMLDVPPCPVDERDLTAAARRHAASGLGAPGPELVDRLTDHFLRVSPERLVSWVHPSWRDLVIDRLAGDGPARRAFLAAASLEGLLLAVSTGGGVEGERAFPLLIEDADWDVLEAAVESQLPRLDSPSLQRLFAALHEALGEAGDARVTAELRFMAEHALECTRWQLDGDPDLGLLEAWLRLADRRAPPVAPPDLSRTWAALLPAQIDLESIEETARLDDWSRLVEMLRNHCPGVLDGFGHPDRTRRLVRNLLAEIELRVCVQGKQLPDAELLARAILRLEPGYRTGAITPQEIADVLFGAHPPHILEESLLADEIEYPPIGEERQHDLVARVLRDLGGPPPRRRLTRRRRWPFFPR